MGVSLQQIKYFVAVFEEGSVSRAAEREDSSQPGLSTQIRKLEKALDNQLFERSVHGVTPTLAGQKFYDHAVGILRSVRKAEQEMAEMGREVSGSIRIGLIPSVVRGFLPSMLPKFVLDYPKVDLNVFEAYSSTLTSWIRNNEVDFGIVIDPPKQKGLVISRLSIEHLVLVTGNSLGFEHGKPLRLSEVEPLNLVLPSTQNSLRGVIDRYIRIDDINVKRVLEMDTMQGAVEFVKNADWATLLPFASIKCDLQSQSNELCINPIVEPDIRADFYLIHQRQRPLSEASRVFIEAMKKEAQELDSTWNKFLNKGDCD